MDDVEAREEELAELRRLVGVLREAALAVLDDASPCTAGCAKMVGDEALERLGDALKQTEDVK